MPSRDNSKIILVQNVDDDGVATGAGGGGTSDATAAKQDEQTVLLTTIDGRVDGLESLVTATNTKLDTIITNTDRTADAAEDPTAVAVTVAGVATAANQSSVIGSAAAGTAATNSQLSGGNYNSGGVTLTTGQQASVQLESNGAQKVSMYAGATGLQVQIPQDSSFSQNRLQVWSDISLASGTSSAKNMGRTASFANDTAGVGVAAIGLGLWSTSDLTRVRVNTATTGSDVELVSATASQTTRVHRARLTSPGTVAVSIKDGTTVLEVINLVAGVPYILDLADRPYWKTTANTALNISLSAAIQVDGVVEYRKTA